MTENNWVAGVDGCKAGWVVVLRNVQTREVNIRTVAKFEEIFQSSEEISVVAVDIPIGLLGIRRDKGRECEELTRNKLTHKDRKSSVFPSPIRKNLDLARQLNFAKDKVNYFRVSSVNSISRQAYSLLAKISDVDQYLLSKKNEIGRVIEVHPELSFTIANGDESMQHKKSECEGMIERRDALIKVGFNQAQLNQMYNSFLRKDVKIEDIHDACIACWTAENKFQNKAICFPEKPCNDQFGLPMVIWA